MGGGGAGGVSGGGVLPSGVAAAAENLERTAGSAAGDGRDVVGGEVIGCVCGPVPSGAPVAVFGAPVVDGGFHAGAFGGVVSEVVGGAAGSATGWDLSRADDARLHSPANPTWNCGTGFCSTVTLTVAQFGSGVVSTV